MLGAAPSLIIDALAHRFVLYAVATVGIENRPNSRNVICAVLSRLIASSDDDVLDQMEKQMHALLSSVLDPEADL
jgi:hypothetical protein